MTIISVLSTLPAHNVKESFGGLTQNRAHIGSVL